MPETVDAYEKHKWLYISEWGVGSLISNMEGMLWYDFYYFRVNDMR